MGPRLPTFLFASEAGHRGARPTSGPLGGDARGDLLGLHMGMTQGLSSALVADAAPTPVRGRAFGVFNPASGIALLLASLHESDMLSPEACRLRLARMSEVVITPRSATRRGVETSEDVEQCRTCRCLITPATPPARQRRSPDRPPSTRAPRPPPHHIVFGEARAAREAVRLPIVVMSRTGCRALLPGRNAAEVSRADHRARDADRADPPFLVLPPGAAPPDGRRAG